MESSRRDLFIDVVVDRFIFKTKQITLSPCFTSMAKTGVELPKTWIRFYCETCYMTGDPAEVLKERTFQTLCNVPVIIEETDFVSSHSRLGTHAAFIQGVAT